MKTRTRARCQRKSIEAMHCNAATFPKPPTRAERTLRTRVRKENVNNNNLIVVLRRLDFVYVHRFQMCIAALSHTYSVFRSLAHSLTRTSVVRFDSYARIRT